MTTTCLACHGTKKRKGPLRDVDCSSCSGEGVVPLRDITEDRDQDAADYYRSALCRIDEAAFRGLALHEEKEALATIRALVQRGLRGGER